MSIHSLAKELGVSEYAIRKYISHKNMAKRNNTRDSYKFTKEDIAHIKVWYSNIKNTNLIFLMYRIYDKNRRHLYLPAGFFEKKHEALIKEFVDMQYSIPNSWGKKCHNFFICSQRQFVTRRRMIEDALGWQLYLKVTTEMTSNLLTIEKIQACVDNKTLIRYEDFVPECAREFFSKKDAVIPVEEVSLDDYYENTLGYIEETDDFSDITEDYSKTFFDEQDDLEDDDELF